MYDVKLHYIYARNRIKTDAIKKEKKMNVQAIWHVDHIIHPSVIKWQSILLRDIVVIMICMSGTTFNFLMIRDNFSLISFSKMKLGSADIYKTSDQLSGY